MRNCAWLRDAASPERSRSRAWSLSWRRSGRSGSASGAEADEVDMATSFRRRARCPLLGLKEGPTNGDRTGGLLPFPRTGCALRACDSIPGKEPAMPAHPLSLQLYTVRDQVASDYAGTLRAVAEIGYRAVELVTLGSFTAAGLRAEIDRLGLQVSGMHFPLDRLEHQIEGVLEEAAALGAPYVICPWLPAERRAGAAAWRGVADSLNRAGERCRAAGRQL